MSQSYNLKQGLIDSALNKLDGLDAVIDRDVGNLDEMLSRVSELDLAFRSGLSNGKADTEKVMEVYKETFHNLDGRRDVQSLDESLSLSSPATEFMAELTNLQSVGRDKAYATASFLDGENNMTVNHYQEFVAYIKSFKEVREGLSEDLAGERESLTHYSEELDEIREDLVELVEDNPLPETDVAEAAGVLEELEDYRKRMQQLRQRRVHEVKRRKEIYDELAENNFQNTYRSAGSKTPVIYEIDHLDDRVEDAYGNMVSAF
ncbi:MAG: hypothetical protein ABEK10_02460 [Candidatus Nanosalina sp.]